MKTKTNFPGWKDKILFTPGPLTTSQKVKQAMLRDLGSRDHEFIGVIKSIREMLLKAGEVTSDEYTTVPLQGSGTYVLEAVIGCYVPQDGKLLVVINGAYGHRIAKIASVLKVDFETMEFPEDQTPDPAKIEAKLKSDPAITNVAITHCETTTGIMNPIKEVGAIVKAAGAKFFVDAMSCFGAVPTNLAECNIDYLVSSANKCIEGVPGFSFVIAKISSLLETEGNARSLSFDLCAQYKGLEANGQFRFTPPTHSMLAFYQALLELEAEGGVEARGARYRNNYETLVKGMREMGFVEYLDRKVQGYIITSFRFPKDSNFSFEKFYEGLNERDYVIYPGKVSNADCFRIGNIGRIFASDVKDLLGAIRDVVDEMGIKLK